MIRVDWNVFDVGVLSAQGTGSEFCRRVNIGEGNGMDTYQYKCGDRPLEGYTIQRAAGKGGFGEVYYAISESGRQVALKAIQSYEQIELRGISQCMNLKSPHLVTIFDVKHNDQGRPFVVMEYVSGPSLADLLKESPGGLGTQKAAFFLREIGKGLSFLHECGIVHRDLKPGNIFYENGYVKIGDYGLTKAIGAPNVSQSINVGTVHYMAPEIGTGQYGRSIDIYSLGVLFYEMLTGQVPFLGSSLPEIFAKHWTAAPDLTNIDEPFARVIKKALAKDPAERYQSVQAMVEDVFGPEHVRNSVSQFAPEELSVVAEHTAQKMQAARQQERPQPGTLAQGEADSDFRKEIGRKAGQSAQKTRKRDERFREEHPSSATPENAKRDATQADRVNRRSWHAVGAISGAIVGGLIGPLVAPTSAAWFKSIEGIGHILTVTTFAGLGAGLGGLIMPWVPLARGRDRSRIHANWVGYGCERGLLFGAIIGAVLGLVGFLDAWRQLGLPAGWPSVVGVVVGSLTGLPVGAIASGMVRGFLTLMGIPRRQEDLARLSASRVSTTGYKTRDEKCKSLDRDDDYDSDYLGNLFVQVWATGAILELVAFIVMQFTGPFINYSFFGPS